MWRPDFDWVAFLAVLTILGVLAAMHKAGKP